MKQIKTIHCRDAEHFDRTVNQALKEGWQLTHRTFDQYGFIAEMEKEIKEKQPKEVSEEEPKEEHCCDNCKYYATGTKEEPCRSCSLDANKWEPKEENPNVCEYCKHDLKRPSEYPCNCCTSEDDKFEPKEKPKEEPKDVHRVCTTCRFENVPLCDYPCCKCRLHTDHNKWEPKE